MTEPRQEIEQLLIRYATAIDTRDWPLLRSCFIDDATTDYGDIGNWSSADELVTFMADAHIGFGETKHMITNFSIDFDADRSHAESRTYVHAVLTVADGSGSWIEFIGEHRDELVRTDQGWRLARRVLRQTRLLAGDGNLALATTNEP